MYFGKHLAVIVGPVEHSGTGGVIVLVHSKLKTRMYLRYVSDRLSFSAGRNQRLCFKGSGEIVDC